MDFMEAVKTRYAVKEFDGRKIPEEKMEQLYEFIRYAPSSFGLQPWKIQIITDQETKEKLLPHSFNQIQVTTCSHLLVFCANLDVKTNIQRYGEIMKEQGYPQEKIDGFTNMVNGVEKLMDEEKKLHWAQRQIYIALSNAMNGCKFLGFESCPMEGFIPAKYSEVLNLPETLVPSVVLPVGYPADKPRPKIRYSRDEMFF